ncbi:type I restriction enzyme, S subunit [Trichococcus flocculiformis]|uniref:restriction endonuclease subunit S n=1 Tax=Trichococcus TaxID=82802 RepID=UPI0007A893BD|nr:MULTISPECIES: restriction endonuclease subunit S [Trichococcus]CZR08793.1 restriction endonuclease type i hsds [Trichococcus sp. ES5]SHG06885.1 type I restriction enzyme, S subunit [Trichococcus flocculiformis]
MSFKNTDIGLIPSEWDFDTIGDSLYIKGRIGWKGLKKSEYIDRSDYRIINGSNVVNNNIDWFGCGYISEERYEESPEIMLKPNDIVMTKDGTIGKLAIIRSLEQKTTVASGLFVIRVEDNSIDVDYLYYYFSSFYFKELVKSRIEGSVIPHLYQKDLVALKLPLPDLSEQKAISKVLRTLDDKIDVNNQINKTLENMAQEIFKQWFVDFEFPNEDGESYKSSGGEMVESELGLIPKGWEVASLYDIADYINGTSFKKNEVNEFEGIPIIKIVEIKNGYSKSTSFYNGTTNKAKKYYLRKRDILFSWSGNPETSIDIFIWSKEQGILNQHIFKVEPYDYSKSYIYFLLKNFKSVFMDIASNKQTTGLGHVTVADLKRLKTPIPNEEILSEFIKISDVIIEKIFNNMQEIETLQSLRDSLLPKLLSGEIRVPLDEEGVVS